MNNLDNLQKLYEENKYILIQKDNFNRNLLHWGTICDYYDISKFLLEKVINFDETDDYFCASLYYSSDKIAELLKKQGAKIKIYNQHLAYKRLIINGININIKDNNKIEIIYKDFSNKNIIKKMHVLKNNNGTIIAKRLFHQKTYNKENKWIPVFHGTRFVSMEHEPLINHIQLGIKMFKY